jgi:hypothetical protein
MTPASRFQANPSHSRHKLRPIARRLCRHVLAPAQGRPRVGSEAKRLYVAHLAGGVATALRMSSSRL